MIAIVLGSASIGFAFSVVNMILVPLLSLHFGTAASGWIISSGMIVAAVSGPFIGFMSDRIGKRLPIIAVITIASFGGTLMLLAGKEAVLVVGGALVAFCAHSFLGPYSALVADNDKSERAGRNFGLVMGTVNTTGFLAALMINRLLNSGFRVTLSALAVGILVPFLFPLVWKLTSSKQKSVESGEHARESPLKFPVAVLKKPVVLFFFLMQFFAWFSIGGLFPYITSFLSSETPLTLARAASWFGASTLLSGLTAFFTGAAVRRFPEKKLLTLALFTLASVGFGYFLFYSHLVSGVLAAFVGVVAFIFSAVAIGFFYSLSSALLAKLVAPSERGAVFGVNSVFMILSQAISVAVVGNAVALYGYRTMVLICSLGFLFAAFSTFGFFADSKVRAESFD